MLDEKTPVTINPWDTGPQRRFLRPVQRILTFGPFAAGEPMYDRLRPLSYPQTHAFLLLFSLVDPASFENVRAKWEPEIRLHCPTAPFILVGTKLDLREDPVTVENLASKRLASISTEQGQEMARQVGARNYYEISSPQMVGVIEVFTEAVGIVVEPQLKRSGRCHLM